jgi:chromosome segregation ATPase
MGKGHRMATTLTRAQLKQRVAELSALEAEAKAAAARAASIRTGIAKAQKDLDDAYEESSRLQSRLHAERMRALRDGVPTGQGACRPPKDGEAKVVQQA